jgi:hypothetical protein
LRIFVAVAASYALVLQIALAGMLATQMAAAATGSSVICYGGSDDAHAPGNAIHQSCVICAVAPAVSLPPAAASTIVRFAAAVDFQHSAERSALIRKLHSPRSSQGPPQTA